MKTSNIVSKWFRRACVENATPRHCRPTVESLEGRVVPALFWGNRGLLSDRFAAAFGASAEQGRRVVDSAINEWNRVVTGVNGSPIDVNLTIRMNPANSATSAFASNTQTNNNGFPTSGTVTINMALDAEGQTKWFLDPTPNDHSEFMGTLSNAFARAPTANGPAAGLRDLRTLLIHEIGHIMGIASGAKRMYDNLNVTMSKLNTADTTTGNPGNSYWLFQGPSVNSLMTDYDIGAGVSTKAGHTALPRPNNAPVLFGNVRAFSAIDTMIPTGLSVRRVLLGNKIALMLRDMGYDVNMPETFGTFHAVLNQTTGVLTVQGGRDGTIINGVDQGNSDDVISIRRQGNQIVASIDVGDDVVGTGAGMSPTDQQNAFVSLFPLANVKEIRVDGLGGNDHISFQGDFNFLVGNKITARGGSGNDLIDASAIAKPVIVFGDDGNDFILGGTGTDQLFGGNGNDFIRGRLGSDYLLGGPGDDHLEGNQGNDTVYGNAGNDRILGGSALLRANQFVLDGADVLGGHEGQDTLFGDNAFGLIPSSLSGGDDVIRGGDGNDTVFGQTGNDTIFGDNGADLLEGGDGSDTVWGGAGNDLVRGGDGNDLLRGEAGDDILVANAGRDELIGHDGRDLMIGGRHGDRLVGETGQDLLIAGFTSHDSNNAALRRIRDEWTSAHPLGDRLSNLRGVVHPSFGLRLNAGTFLRKGINVFDDGGGNALQGQLDVDWFFFGPGDITDRAGEPAN